MIKTPVKGAFCNHINCFSLENYLYANEKNVLRKWRCPICKLKAYDLIVDEYFVEILKKSQLKNIQTTEVTFNSNGEYTYVEEEDEDDYHNFGNSAPINSKNSHKAEK